MQTRTKILLGIAAAAAAFLLFSNRDAVESFGGRVRDFLAQNASAWGRKILGFGTATIGGAGCFLTVLTMAANTLKGRSMTPDTANDIVKAAGGFDGSLLILPTAARALGVVANESERIRNSPNISSLRAKIDDTLARGGLAIVAVNKGVTTGTGDHFILVHSSSAEGYAGADPATGKDTILDGNLRGTAHWGSAAVPYTGVGVAPVFA